MPPLRLTVIGGGFTGIVFAIHAIRAFRRPLAITIVEPTAILGRGVAYGTRDTAHRINVPSQRMGVFAGDPMQPTQWFFDHGVLPDPSSEDAQGHFYVTRHAYGSFIRDLFDATLQAAAARVALRHVTASACDVIPTAASWCVTVTSGPPIEADVVALCFGHATPAAPGPVTSEALAHPKFIADPWREAALSPLAGEDAVLLVGTGLTMADVATSLLEHDHRGSVTAISRRGLLPRDHGLFINDLDVLDGAPAPQTALDLLRLVRHCIQRFGSTVGWQPAVDSVRTKLPLLWAALPPLEKRRVVKRLLPFWEVHRFRIAPQVRAVLTGAVDDGRLAIMRSTLLRVERRDDRFLVTLGDGSGSVKEQSFDGVVLCTGPDKDLSRNSLAAAVLARGLAKIDDAGLGIAVDSKSRVLDAAGQVQPTLLAFGPLTRGTFGEMTGAPDIARHIESIIGAALGAAVPAHATS